MPVYEYECRSCSHRFEEWQKINDKPVKVCPKCKAKKVERLISQTSFQLKGGGWYGDLYASAKPKDPGKVPDQTTDKSTDKPADKSADTAKDATKDAAVKSTAKETTQPTTKDKPKKASAKEK